MARHITSPTLIEAAGTKPKIIEEFIGMLNTQTEGISIARMRSPSGWTEPGQTPEFDEYTLVIKGMLRVKTIEGYTDIKAGEAIMIKAGEWVQYSTPHENGAEYIAVCTPAFSPGTVNRDERADPMQLSEEQVKQLAAQLRKPTGNEGLKTGAWMNEGNESLIRQVYERMGRFPSEKVLEIGFGNGRYNEILLSKNGNSFMAGIDYSADMVKIASKINSEFIENGTMILQEASAENMPFEDNYFDQACSSNTIYFWREPAEVLEEIKRVLKPGGLLALGYRPKSSVEQLPFVKHGFTLYSVSDVEMLLQENGFEVIDTVVSEDGKLQSACTCSRRL